MSPNDDIFVLLGMGLLRGRKDGTAITRIERCLKVIDDADVDRGIAKITLKLVSMMLDYDPAFLDRCQNPPPHLKVLEDALWTNLPESN